MGKGGGGKKNIKKKGWGEKSRLSFLSQSWSGVENWVCLVSLEQCEDRAFTEDGCPPVIAWSVHLQTVEAIHKLPGLDAEGSFTPEETARG